jgi:hypothetical protein
MGAKLGILNELVNILTKKEKKDEGDSHFFKTVQIRAVIKAI